MSQSIKDLKKKLPPTVVSKARKKTQKLLAELPLQELRRARELSQEQLADMLHIKQSSVSKLEHRTDMYVSTLRNFIRAMGGELEISAVFPEGVIRIDQFQQINMPGNRKSV